MSTQQDIYAAGSENRPPMLNKENYVLWSSRLLWYAKSRPNGKLIHNSIINGPYVRRMIHEPGDPNRKVPVNETFHVQTDDELTDKELKHIEADDQAIRTILLGLPEDIYAAVDSCETAQEIWLRVQQMMKGSDIGIQEKKAKTQDPLALMATSNNPYTFPVLHQDQPSFNQNYMQQPMPNPKDITDPTTAMNMELALMAKELKLNYSTPTNNNKRISSNLRNRQIAQSGMNMGQDRHMQMVGGNGGNQFRQYARQNVRNLNGYHDIQNVRNQEEAGIQLRVEELDLMATASDLDEFEEYTELLEPIPEPHQVPQNDNNVISEVSCVEQSGRTVEQHPANVEKTRVLYDSLYNNLAIEVEKVNTVNRKLRETNAELTTELARYKNQEKCFEINLNKQLSIEKSIVSSLLEEKKKLKSDFKIRKDELLDKQIQREKKIKELDNILVKTGQSIRTIHMLLPKPDSFYHTEQKMALGYQNPFYLKDTTTCSRKSPKMKQLNKEIKPANCTKIIHLSEVFVSQMAKSREELYFLNTSKMANVSKPVSIPNEEFSNDTTPSVARKFLNEVKSTIVTLQRVFKQRMTLETHNWSSSAHQKLHKIVKDEIFPRVQYFEIQFLKEAAKFFGDFKSLAKEADEYLAKHQALELEIKHLLRAVVSQDIMSIVKNNSVVEISNLQTELEPYNDMQQKIERLQAQLGDLKGKSKDTSCVSDTLNPLSQKLENKNVELEFQVSDQKDTSRGTSVKNKFAKQSILGKPPKECLGLILLILLGKKSMCLTKLEQALGHSLLLFHNLPVSQPPVITKKVVNSDSNGLSSTGVDNTKTIRPQPRSNTKNDRVPSASKSSQSKNKEGENVKSKVVCSMCKQCLISINHDVCLLNYVNGMTFRGKKQKANVSFNEKQKKQQPKVIQICLWCVDSGCSKHMTKNLNLLINFVLKFLGTVRFRNDHIAAILDFRDLQWGNILITRVYFVERLGHNLFSIGQFCDSDLEVQFLRLKDEAPEVIKTFLKRITVLLQSSVIIIRTDNGTEFKNQNDRADIGKLGAKGDIGFFIGYSVDSCAFKVYNLRTKKIMETMKVSFNKLSMMAFEQRSSKPGLQSMTSGQISSRLDLTYAPSTITSQQPTEGKLDLLFEAMYDDYISGQPSAALRIVSAAQAHQVRQTPMTSTSIAVTAPTPTHSSSQATNFPNTS
uniref:Integrase, catalytic region, zinc finger, CCHC-type, peptidase aspartic, catalytic n=1 Tax=Tanacetum cinerariifolium TaxID=118510 RepID=A0A6L2MCT0_TANCI|nr:integrase, catalytic region, zinc finger, CCHC-type, peptidase aspartic, catalytic [Tanacetum cinerariifolium]